MPLALPRRRALPDAMLKSNKAGACSRFVKGKKKKKKEKKARRKERRAGRRAESASKFFREARGQKRRKEKREGKRGKDEKRTRTKKKKNEWVSGEKRGGRLDVVETTKPKRRIGER